MKHRIPFLFGLMNKDQRMNRIRCVAVNKILVIIAALGSIPCHAALLSNWTFANGSLEDQSGHGNTLTSVDTAPVANRFGAANQAVGLNNTSSYLFVENDGTALTGSNATVSAWINPQDFVGLPFVGTRFSSTYAEIFKLGFQTDGRLDFRVNGVAQPVPEITIPTNAWTHLAVTFDGLAPRYYMNGIQVPVFSSGIPAIFNSSDGGSFVIGADRDAADNFNQFLGGAIDEVRLYDETLDGAAIRTLASVGAATFYVATNGNDSAVGTSWETAKQTIQAAVDMAVAGDTVLVSNGVYATGARVTPSGVTSNRVVITKSITIQSVNGAGATTILGEDHGDDPSSMRCVYMSKGTLDGFTLTGGYAPDGPNQDSGSGGGAYASGGTLNNCIVTSNGATYGGGVCLGELNNCTLAFNGAVYGGGSYQSVLYNCVLSENWAGEDGGGSYQGGLISCRLNGNYSDNDGGGSFGSTLRNCTLSDNAANDDGGGSYGGFLANSIIYGNTAHTSNNYFGGTLTYCLSDPLPAGAGNIAGDPLFVNAASNNFRLQVGSPSLDAGTNSQVVGSTDLDGNPRILGTRVDMGAYESDDFIVSNTTTDMGFFTIQAAVDAANPGEEIVVFAGTVTEAGITIDKNLTIRGEGQAETIVQAATAPGIASDRVFLVVSGTVLIADMTIRHGYATPYGGGVYADYIYSTTTLSNCTLYANQAYGVGALGGGVYRCTLYNCVLSGNSSSYRGGGAYDSALHNCTLTANNAGAQGGGSSWGTLQNCIVYDNTAYGGPNYFGDTLTYCLSDPLPSGAGNITGDPLFKDAGAGNYRLDYTSPCINAGNNAQAVGSTDLDGNPRIVQQVDMGAYEYQGYWGWASAITNGLTGYTDSAVGDGIPNLLKYATGSSPTNSDDASRLDIDVSNGVMSVIFNRNPDADDISIIVETTDSLTNGLSWSGIATNRNGIWTGPSVVTESATGSVIRVRARDIQSDADVRFGRLRITFP